jgi:hypothetical protein
LTTALEQARFATLHPVYGRGCPDCSQSSITWAGRTVTILQLPGVVAIPPRLARALSLLNRVVHPGYGGLARSGHRIP